nr:GrBNV gp97-like protein [Apis mellifera nudivirus]
MEYFDESIFMNGFSIRNYSSVTVNNDADRYLLLRLGKEIISEKDVCSSRQNIININPRISCAGINIYTMNALNKKILRHIPYYAIEIRRNSGSDNTVVPVYIGEPRSSGNIIYDIGMIDDFSSAIMIKYFSMQSIIKITPRLYTLISRHFEDSVKRFYFDIDSEPGLVQLTNGELLYNNEPVQHDDGLLDLNIYSPAIEI